MKTTALFVALALTSLPAFALALDVTDPSAAIDTTAITDTTTTTTTVPTCTNCYSTDIKAYGEQTASHSLGTMNVTSVETGYTNTNINSFQGTANVINGNPCIGAGCNFQIAQGDFTNTITQGHTDTTTNVNLNSYTANVNMNSFGGMAVCTTANPAAYGNFTQLQNISQTVNGPNGSVSTYNGSQNLTLKSIGTP